jgi:hypothetical protein
VTDVVADLTAWAGPGSFEDDVSLVVIDWAGEAASAAGSVESQPCHTLDRSEVIVA